MHSLSAITPFRADLHCHTTFSDGTLTPQELIAEAKAIGLSGLSITDHDTVGAYPEAIPVAQAAGILLGVGVEFSSDFQGLSVHILGYHFPFQDQEIAALCQRHQQRRVDRNRAILRKLDKMRMPIAEEELIGKVIGRPHIAALMVQKGYVSSLQEAFHNFLGEGKSCYDPGVPVTTEETIRIIQSAGGKAFLAHPHLMRGGKKMRALLELPFNGIECRYARMLPVQEKRWLKVAQEKGWLASGGSDFHGATKPSIPLGCSWVDRATFSQIFSS